MSVEVPRREKDEGERLAKVLRSLSQPIEPLSGFSEPLGSASGDIVNLSCSDKALRLYQQRRRRAEIFGPPLGMLTEPAWDILLLLFIAHERGRPVRSDGLFLPSEFDARVAKRWVAALQQAGWVRVWEDPSFAEPLVALSPTGVLKMLQFLREVPVLG